MFDSLSSVEQLLLKCAAVLGETFSKKMVESLLEETTQREICLAVKKLFELRILACAMGDFERSPGPIFFVRHARNPNIDMDIRCGCTGITIDGTYIKARMSQRRKGIRLIFFFKLICTQNAVQICQFMPRVV